MDLELGKATLHVSTINVGAHAFDSGKASFDMRSKLPIDTLIVADDDGAVIKPVAKGRSAK